MNKISAVLTLGLILNAGSLFAQEQDTLQNAIQEQSIAEEQQSSVTQNVEEESSCTGAASSATSTSTHGRAHGEPGTQYSD